jgi:hypothetical protein
MNMQSSQDRGMMPPFLRQQLFIEPVGKKDRLLTQLIKKRTAEQIYHPQPVPKPNLAGLVTWTPSDELRQKEHSVSGKIEVFDPES